MGEKDEVKLDVCLYNFMMYMYGKVGKFLEQQVLFWQMKGLGVFMIVVIFNSLMVFQKIVVDVEVCL